MKSFLVDGELESRNRPTATAFGHLPRAAAWTCATASPTFRWVGGIVAVDADRLFWGFLRPHPLNGQRRVSGYEERRQDEFQEMPKYVGLCWKCLD